MVLPRVALALAITLVVQPASVMGQTNVELRDELLDDTTGKCELFPIDDEAEVDSRRRELGMVPLAEYVKMVCGDE